MTQGSPARSEDSQEDNARTQGSGPRPETAAKHFSNPKPQQLFEVMAAVLRATPNSEVMIGEGEGNQLSQAVFYFFVVLLCSYCQGNGFYILVRVKK